MRESLRVFIYIVTILFLANYVLVGPSSISASAAAGFEPDSATSTYILASQSLISTTSALATSTVFLIPLGMLIIGLLLGGVFHLLGVSRQSRCRQSRRRQSHCRKSRCRKSRCRQTGDKSGSSHP